MQTQNSTDGVSSTNNEAPRQGLLQLGIAVGWILLISGLAMLFYSLWQVTYPEEHAYNSFGEYVQVDHSGIMWYYWAPLMLVGSLMAGICWEWHYDEYQHVAEGKIVDEYEVTHFFGATSYYFVIEGETAVGQKRRCSRSVSSKTYFKMNVGDDFKQ